MSLILEALKKSEAKRRLGEAPDLGTPFATPRRRGRILPLLVLAMAAAGAFGWWLLRQPTAAGIATGTAQKPAATQPAAAAKPAVPAPTARPALAQDTPAAAVQSPKPASAEPLPAMPAAQSDASSWVAVGKPDNRRANAPAPRKLPPNMHRVEPATQVADQSPAPTGGAKAANVQPVQGAAPNAPALAKAPKTPDMRGLTPPAPPTAPDAAPMPKAAESIPAAGQSTTSLATKKDVPFYYELPFNVRKTLPPLRLSMHVYAGDPAQRFVVLNDSRLAEGDKTADDVTLREVRKDGAVLEFQGQRFFYPRDGY